MDLLTQPDPSLSMANHVLSTFETETLILETKDTHINVADIKPVSSSGSSDDVDHSVSKESRYGDFDRKLLDKDSYLFSSLATYTAESMMANGCTGETQEVFLNHLRVKSEDEFNVIFPLLVQYFSTIGKDHGGPRLVVATRIWVDRSLTLNPPFQEAIKNVYKADVEQVDFFPKDDKNPAGGVSEQVTGWVRDVTRKAIEDSLGSNVMVDDDQTRLILSAAVDFQGEWKEQFDASQTREHDFRLPSGELVKAPFMTTNSSKSKQYVKQFDHFKVLSIPFKQKKRSNLSMLFLLPNAIDGYKIFQNIIGVFEHWMMDVNLADEAVQVNNLLVPKFKLKMIGNQPFNLPFDQTVDDSFHLNSYKLVHSSFLEIDEKGARAAGAITGFFKAARKEIIDIKPHSRSKRHTLPSEEIDFIANRPFFIFIRDNKIGKMLFVGGLTNPLISFT